MWLASQAQAAEWPRLAGARDSLRSGGAETGHRSASFPRPQLIWRIFGTSTPAEFRPPLGVCEPLLGGSAWKRRLSVASHWCEATAAVGRDVSWDSPPSLRISVCIVRGMRAIACSNTCLRGERSGMHATKQSRSTADT